MLNLATLILPHPGPHLISPYVPYSHIMGVSVLVYPVLKTDREKEEGRREGRRGGEEWRRRRGVEERRWRGEGEDGRRGGEEGTRRGEGEGGGEVEKRRRGGDYYFWIITF